jgi:hypothetical protein
MQSIEECEAPAGALLAPRIEGANRCATADSDYRALQLRTDSVVICPSPAKKDERRRYRVPLHSLSLALVVRRRT